MTNHKRAQGDGNEDEDGMCIVNNVHKVIFSNFLEILFHKKKNSQGETT